MQKLVFVLLVGSVVIGAMMPGQRTVPADVRPTPERVVDVSSSDSDSSQAASADLGSGTITLERSSDGHFYAEAQVNGMPVNFLVDTGASGIALTKDDARRAGIYVSEGPGQVIGNGASGEVRGEFVTVERVNLGVKEVRGMNAAVLHGGDQSLLGQSFLSQFGSVSIEGDRMVLR